MRDDAPAREAERILAAAEGWRLVLFDVAGEPITSAGLAERVRGWEEQAPQRTAFAIGGADGFDPSVTAAAAARLSLGGITLPHQLARVVAAEQIYRALTILQGHPYHRA